MDAEKSSSDPRNEDEEEGPDATNLPPGDDKTLVEDDNPRENDIVEIEDWSQTGRGSHVEFNEDEHVPIEQGAFLGRGAMGDVHEVFIQGHKVAHKRMVVKRKLGGKEKKEIEILKRLSSHEHMIQLLGTYTHRQFLGILLYPVAVCDMHTFFEDVEAWHNTGIQPNTLETRQQMLDVSQKGRLTALGYQFPSSSKGHYAIPAYSKIGCLVSAISYLHDQKIRHKDLKPSNILLSKGRLWLSDFGSATDFSLLSHSATDNERGTPRYFSPEVAAWQPNGRASDMFSLGCILLEISILQEQGTLDQVRHHRAADPAFHANIGNIGKWLNGPVSKPRSVRRTRLVDEIRSMLSPEPPQRPTAKQALIRISGYDVAHRVRSNHSIFGDCCKAIFMPFKSHREQITRYKHEIDKLSKSLALRDNDLLRAQLRTSVHRQRCSELKEQYEKVEEHNKSLQAALEELTLELEKTRQESKEKIETMRLKERDTQVVLEQLRTKWQRGKTNIMAERDRFKACEEQWEEEKKALSQRIAQLEAQVRPESHETWMVAHPAPTKELSPFRQRLAAIDREFEKNGGSSQKPASSPPGLVEGDSIPPRQNVEYGEQFRSLKSGRTPPSPSSMTGKAILKIPGSLTNPASMPYRLKRDSFGSIDGSIDASIPAEHDGGSGTTPTPGTGIKSSIGSNATERNDVPETMPRYSRRSNIGDYNQNGLHYTNGKLVLHEHKRPRKPSSSRNSSYSRKMIPIQPRVIPKKPRDQESEGFRALFGI